MSVDLGFCSDIIELKRLYGTILSSLADAAPSYWVVFCLSVGFCEDMRNFMSLIEKVAFDNLLSDFFFISSCKSFGEVELCVSWC